MTISQIKVLCELIIQQKRQDYAVMAGAIRAGFAEHREYKRFVDRMTNTQMRDDVKPIRDAKEAAAFGFGYSRRTK